MVKKHREGAPHIGKRLASARVTRGLSQAEVAERAEISPSYLSRLESGKVQPTFRVVLDIATGIGADLQEVLGPEFDGKSRKGACPVTEQGQCLLDLISLGGSEGSYTPNEVRLLRRFATWLKRSDEDRVRAMEIMLNDLLRSMHSGKG